MKTSIVFTVGMLAGICGCALAQTPSAGITHPLAERTTTVRGGTPFSWPTDLAQASRLKLTREQVAAFLDTLESDTDSPAFTVDSFRFAVLDHAGVSLVAVTDTSGRNLFYTLTVVTCMDASTCKMATLPSSPPHNLDQDVVDVDHDGLSEIITKELAGQYEGAATKAVYTYNIYKLETTGFVDVSQQNRSFYENVILGRMKEDERRAMSAFAGDSGELKEAHAEVKFAQSYYQRHVAGNPNSGLAEASQWQTSSDKRIANLAVKTLADIDTAEATDSLKLLSKSSDQVTARSASLALQRKSSTAQ